MKKVIGRYRITYESGIVQEKNLVKHKDYIDILAKTDDPDDLKKLFKESFGDFWFTDQSPLYRAIETGVVILAQGEINCKIELIN